MKVETRTNYLNLTEEFYFQIWFIKFKKILSHEVLTTSNKLPLWFRLTKWYIQFSCKHSWEKYGVSYLATTYFTDSEDGEMYHQKYKCKNCSKEGIKEFRY